MAGNGGCIGKPTLFMFAFAVGAVWLASQHKHTRPQASAPRPVTRTVIVHQTVTRIVQVTGHTGLPAWAIVIIVIVALGVFCSLAWKRTEEG